MNCNPFVVMRSGGRWVAINSCCANSALCERGKLRNINNEIIVCMSVKKISLTFKICENNICSRTL